MANEPDQSEEEPKAKKEDRLTRLVRWASASRLRKALVGSGALCLLAGTFTAWSYLAHLAVSDENPATLARAMEAMDNENFEEARSIVEQMQVNPHQDFNLGASLFVLGAVKAAEAELEWSADRSRAMHLVAARYLQKARSLGVPPVRQIQLDFSLGQSLIRGNQPQGGIDVLQELLSETQDELISAGISLTQIHGLLSEAYLGIPEPNLDLALKYSNLQLEDNTLSKKLRTNTLLAQVEIQRRLGNIEEARETLAIVSRDQSPQAIVMSISGRLELSAAVRLPKGEERSALFEKALSDLQEAQRLDPLNGELTRQAMFWIGRCKQLVGDIPAAINQYNRISKQFGDTPESIAATLIRSDLDRELGDFEKAIAGYRSVLESVGEPLTYVNPLLPMSKLRKRMLSAQAYFVDRNQFEHAMTMVDQLPLLLEQVDVIKMRGKTHEQWGKFELERAARLSVLHGKEATKRGRYHLRAAGRDFETLSELRFATREFPEDLWRAADNYYRGQSYTHAASVLEKYLHHEARARKAPALLRLGQSLVATNQPEKAIAAFEECIEMHPDAGAVYQARLDCVRAYRQLGNNKKAEEVLLTNLRLEQLQPSSSEWRDSLFALGELLHDLGRFDESIKKLDEAVLRYPNNPQSTLARYTIARSYHNAAEAPAERIRVAKTENERQKNRKFRDQNLELALKNYLIVQRTISSEIGHGSDGELRRTLLRNCYMMQGSVLFELKRYEEARKAYSNVSTLYQNEPFVLESFVHIANCWSRLSQPVKARGAIEQAKLMLGTLPPETDFKVATNFDRQQWDLLLDEMSKW